MVVAKQINNIFSTNFISQLWLHVFRVYCNKTARRSAISASRETRTEENKGHANAFPFTFLDQDVKLCPISAFSHEHPGMLAAHCQVLT